MESHRVMNDENPESESASICHDIIQDFMDEIPHNIQSKRFKLDDKLVDVGTQAQPINSIDIHAYRKLLFKQKDEYTYKLELGNITAKILQEGEIRPNHLTNDQKEALELYRREYTSVDDNITLRPWQQEAMSYLEKPTDRQIIWVYGQHGNEGKTWFQRHIQTIYGNQRVARLEIQIKTPSLLHVLRKKELATINIFLFNMPRSNEDPCNYEILEAIKDGFSTASKYDTEIINFNSPNVLMVFANCYPEKRKLSQDRLLILRISQDRLFPE